jgi:hypothetical protein
MATPHVADIGRAPGAHALPTTPLPCAICGTKPRIGSLSRCLPCIRKAADENCAYSIRSRQQERERKEAAKKRKPKLAAQSRSASPRKACRSCGKTKSLDAFARHARSRDGHCHACRVCASRAGLAPCANLARTR